MLVVSLTGWVDAGMAGAGAVAVLAEQLDVGADVRAASTSPTCMDLQQTRPTVQLVDGVTREIAWPSIDLVAGRHGRDVVVCAGPEPSLRWRAVLGELVDVAAAART